MTRIAGRARARVHVHYLCGRDEPISSSLERRERSKTSKLVTSDGNGADSPEPDTGVGKLLIELCIDGFSHRTFLRKTR